MRWISRLVTVVVVVTIVTGAALLIRSKVPSTTMGQGFATWTKLHDASRLQIGSPVVIAGVRIGDITGLKIEGRLARVDMRLVDNIELPVDSFATRRADSLFGDSYIEIIPGGAEGAQPSRLLRSGEPIVHVQEGGSTDTTLRTISKTMPKIDNALTAVHSFMTTGRKWVNGPMIERLTDADHWLSQGRIEGPLSSLDSTLERFEARTASAADAVAGAAPDVAKTLDGFDDGLVSARKRIKTVKEGFITAMSNTREGFDRADKTIAQLGDVMSAIDEGKGEDWKGTLGRLVNDPQLAEDIEDFTADAAEGTASNFNHFKSWIGARFEVSAITGSVRVYASAELYARSDKFYLIEFEKSDLGGAVDSSLADTPGSGDYTRTQVIKEKLRFTAQFGKRFGFMRLRGGLKDSSPGIGADALFFDGRLKLSTDLFGSFDKTPRLKVAGALAIFRSVYILAGVDDVLNKPGNLNIRPGNTPVPVEFQTLRYGRDYFLGVGLRFDDADLSTILRVYGALITGFVLTQ